MKKLLLERAVAGVEHHTTVDLLEEIAEDDELELVCEPSNPYDPFAVRVEWNGRKIGYVPMAISRLVHELIVGMDCYTYWITATASAVIPRRATIMFQLWMSPE